MDELLVPIMRDLWVLMAELATLPENRSKLTPGSTAVTQEMVDELEHRIDELDTRFEPPTEFVVPGEHPVAAWLDLARTVVRRAERHSLVAAEPPSLVVPYLNRLSDLLWTMARWQEGGDSLKVREVYGGAVPRRSAEFCTTSMQNSADKGSPDRQASGSRQLSVFLLYGIRFALDGT